MKALTNIFFLVLLGHFCNAQEAYRKQLFIGDNTSLLKKADGSYWMIGNAYNSDTYVDMYFTELDISDGSYAEREYLGTSSYDINYHYMANTASDGQRILYATSATDTDSVAFGIIDTDNNSIIENYLELTNVTNYLHLIEADDHLVLMAATWEGQHIHGLHLLKNSLTGTAIWHTDLFPDGLMHFEGADVIRTATDEYLIVAAQAATDSTTTRLLFVKVNDQGEILWRKSLRRDIPTDLIKMQVTDNGEFVLMVDGILEPDFGNSYFGLIWIDDEGEVQKEIKIEFPQQYVSINDLLQEGQNFIAAGSIRSKQDYYKGAFFKFDADGQLIWERTFPVPSSPNASTVSSIKSIVPTSDGYLLSGDWFSGSFFYAMLYRLNYDGRITSIHPMLKENELQIAPNPTSDYLQITSEVGIDRIELWDVQGKLLIQQQENTKEMNLAELAAGTYFLKTFAGGKIWLNKILKQ